MEEDKDRVKIRVRIKERIPEENRRRAPRRHDVTLWIIATVLLGICLGYLITDRLLAVFKTPRTEYGSRDESVARTSAEKMVLEHEDLLPTPTPESKPAI